MTHHNHPKCQALCPACEIGPFVRNHYFNGKLLLERDFTDEQRYQIDKLRHHHQRLHGWGVVCGLKVKAHPNEDCRNRFICIEPGTAIDCCGHEIVVREEECVDITQLPRIKELIGKKDDQPHILQICLRYRECPTEEIPVLYDECGCDDTKCAPNRILESYDVDVIVDPKDEPPPVHTPRLKWEHSVNIAHAARVAVHGATHRLYILTADTPGNLYQISTDNHTAVTSRNLPAKGLTITVSNNGERVYVVTEPTAPTNVRQLHVLDATKPGLPSINADPIDVPNSAGSDVVLAVAPDNHLLGLVTTTGDVQRWDTNIDSQSAPAAPALVKNLGVNLKTLALSSDGKLAYAAGMSDEIQVLEIATKNVTKIKVLPAGSNISTLIVVKSTGPDVLAAADQNGNQMHLVAPNPAALIGSVALNHTPIGLTVSPGGQWAYVLGQDTAGSFVEAVSLHRIQLKLSPVVGAPFKVGDASQQIVVSDSGTHLYIPFTDDTTKPAVGGVAVLDVSEQACEEILWRHLDGCPHCDMPNCVVLATIEDYHAGASIEDTNIDNRKGRRLLPSTQVLKEWIECLLQQGPGGTAPQGPPGSPGKDGLGIEAVQATIIECTATPAAPDIQMINGLRTLVLQIPRGCNGINGADGEKGDPGIDDVDLTIVPCGTPELAEIVTDTSGKRTLKLNIPTGCDTELTHICAINWSHGKKTQSGILRDHGLLVAFDHEVRNGDIHKHSFLLLQRLRPEGPSAGCWCEVPTKRVGGVIFRRQCTITEEFEMLDDPNRPVNGAQLLPQEELQQGREYRVVLKGDFIRDEKDKGIDANHLPPWFPSQDYVTGDGVEGGTFESWFLITD